MDHDFFEAVPGAGKAKRILTVLLCFTAFHFAYTANICYTKAAIQQEQTIGYFNRMITHIQETEGYTAEMPVVYIGADKKNEEAFYLDIFDNLYQIEPYDFSSGLNLYNWITYMNIWNGFMPTQVLPEEQTELENSPEIREMPCYPDAGSVRMINNRIVVRFS